MSKDEPKFYISFPNYPIPEDPKELRHKRMNFVEWIFSLLIDSHVCLICGRKEFWWNKGGYWLQVNNQGDTVCNKCVECNPEIFGEC